MTKNTDNVKTRLLSLYAKATPKELELIRQMMRKIRESK